MKTLAVLILLTGLCAFVSADDDASKEKGENLKKLISFFKGRPSFLPSFRPSFLPSFRPSDLPSVASLTDLQKSYVVKDYLLASFVIVVKVKMTMMTMMKYMITKITKEKVQKGRDHFMLASHALRDLDLLDNQAEDLALLTDQPEDPALPLD